MPSSPLPSPFTALTPAASGIVAPFRKLHSATAPERPAGRFVSVVALKHHGDQQVHGNPSPLTAPAVESVVSGRLLSAFTWSFAGHAVASPLACWSRRLIISHASHRGHDTPVPLRVPILPFALPAVVCAAASVAPLVCHA